MIYAYPYVPIAGSVRIGVAIFSYLGSLKFGVTADYDSVPDIDVLTRGIEAGVAQLLAVARRNHRPGRISRTPSSTVNGNGACPLRSTRPRSASSSAGGSQGIAAVSSQ